MAICEVEDLPPGERLLVEVDGEELCLLTVSTTPENGVDSATGADGYPST